MAIGVAARPFATRAGTGTVLLRALRRLAAICRSLAMVRLPSSACWMDARVEEHPCHQ
jgi:hypothetical protein